MNQIVLIVLLALGLLCWIVGGMSLKKCKLGGILLIIMGFVCVGQSGYLGIKNKRVAPAPVAAVVVP